MFRDIDKLMIRLMIYESDIVLNGATETLYLMCNCVNISNWLWHGNNNIKLRILNYKAKLISIG